MTPKLVKITCNLTGETYSWYQEYVDKRLEYYDSMELLEKYYIQNKILKQMLKGTKLEDLASLFGFELDPSKGDYYKELVAYHLDKAKDTKKVRVQSTTSTIETDEEVASFIVKFRGFLTELLSH